MPSVVPSPRSLSDELATYAARVGEPIRSLGGAFMLDPATIAAGQELGLDFPISYGLGRGGVLGDVHADVVIAAFVFFESSVVQGIWDAGRELVAPAVAAEGFTESCRVWGRTHLSSVDGLDELCALAERVVAAASVPGLPLFAAWRAVPLPADLPARAAQLCHVLREHRGGCHAIGVLASGLHPLEALVVNGGSATASLFGWPEPHPRPLELTAAAVAAEAITNRLAAGAYLALTAPERDRLAVLLKAAASAAGLDAPSNRIEDARRAAEGDD